MAQHKHIVFVCTGNTCRSPMAAALLRAALDERGLSHRYTVSSAGVAAGADMPAADSAIDVLAQEYNLDLSTHRSAALDDHTVAAAAYIVVMTAGHKQEVLRRWPDVAARVYTLGEFVGEPYGPDWDVRDPFGRPMAEYAATARMLHEAIQHMADRLQQKM